MDHPIVHSISERMYTFEKNSEFYFATYDDSRNLTSLSKGDIYETIDYSYVIAYDSDGNGNFESIDYVSLIINIRTGEFQVTVGQ